MMINARSTEMVKIESSGAVEHKDTGQKKRGLKEAKSRFISRSKIKKGHRSLTSGFNYWLYV
jgi:hypothetical protein